MIFIISCKSNKYYICSIDNDIINVLRYFKELDNEWTKKYIPIDVYNVLGNENNIDDVVAEYMLNFGIQNVRGGSFVTNNLTQEQTIDILKKMETKFNNSNKNTEYLDHSNCNIKNIFKYSILDSIIDEKKKNFSESESKSIKINFIIYSFDVSQMGDYNQTDNYLTKIYKELYKYFNESDKKSSLSGNTIGNIAKLLINIFPQEFKFLKLGDNNSNIKCKILLRQSIVPKIKHFIKIAFMCNKFNSIVNKNLILEKLEQNWKIANIKIPIVTNSNTSDPNIIVEDFLVDYIEYIDFKKYKKQAFKYCLSINCILDVLNKIDLNTDTIVENMIEYKIYNEL